MKVIDKELAISLGKRIRYFRKERKFSQEKLAVVSGLHRTYIGGCERGEKNITVQTVSKLSSALGVTLDEFFSCDSLNKQSGKA